METKPEDLAKFLSMGTMAFESEIFGLYETFIKSMKHDGVSLNWLEVDEKTGTDKRLYFNISTVYLLGILRCAMNDEVSKQVKGLFEDIQNVEKNKEVSEKK